MEMKTSMIPDFVMSSIEYMVYVFVFVIGSLVAWIIALYFVDRFQKKSTLRRNYPVLARFRYLFEHMGEFFRQYFFAMDREEMPFNRAERSWVYRAAKDVDSTVAFGSTKDLNISGTIHFVNCSFPLLEEEEDTNIPHTIGPHCKNPFTSHSIFNISGMSYGSLSIPAIKALSHGAKKAGIWLNTGEGGLSSYHLEGGADIIFQIGTAKFGVRKKEGGFDEAKLKEIASHTQVKMFEIKLSQGAKPGKGGILPGNKVTKEIAEIRNITIGDDAISPNRHPEISSVADILDMINYVRTVTEKPVGIKMVVGHPDFFNDLCLEIHKRGIKSAPDFIAIDSADGGTGAAPMSLMDNMGLPLKESLPIVIDLLRNYKLKERITIIASGKLITPSDVAWAFCMGADFAVTGRGFMFSLGCIQALQCNKNTCPTGITTHNKKLQYGLDPSNKAVRVMHYAHNMEKEVRIIARSCGVSSPRQLQRKHARMVMGDGTSIGLNELYPETVD